MKTCSKRYTVGKIKNTSVWIHDAKKEGAACRGQVIRFGRLGDGTGAMQTYRQAVTLANKVCRFLNGEK